MTDDSNDDSLSQAEEELARAQRDVEQHLRAVHRLEALGQDDAAAQRKLEALLEALEAAQQRYKVVRSRG
jgi:hypothetical protein